MSDRSNASWKTFLGALAGVGALILIRCGGEPFAAPGGNPSGGSAGASGAAGTSQAGSGGAAGSAGTAGAGGVAGSSGGSAGSAGAPAGCNNNTREGSEVCDGADVGTETCASVSAVSTATGALACKHDCSGFDLAACRAPLPAPRQMAPLSTATVTSQTPTLRWELALNTDGVHVELLQKRDGSQPIVEFDSLGSTGMPPTALPPGVWFWRLRSMKAGVRGDLSSPVWQFNVGKRSAPVDASWGTTFDINGDGFADLVIGGGTDPGTAYVYAGSSAGVSGSPATTLQGNDNPGQFGSAVASAGDVNGDGFADLIVGAPAASANKGVAYLYYGGPSGVKTTPEIVLEGASANAWFGQSVASAGDTNGDGYADVIVGAPAWSAGPVPGNAYVYFGSSTGLSLTRFSMISNNEVSGQFGRSVAAAGDVNGDGFGDVVVGTGNGTALVFPGASSGPSAPGATLYSDSPTNGFGRSVACAGDINGDGYADLVVGADAAVKSSTVSVVGAVFVYQGTKESYLVAISKTLWGATDKGNFGRSVASADDFNGDGYADIVVGAHGEDNGKGKAYLYVGAADGVSDTSSAIMTGSSSGGQFGWPVSGAGDVNGDGFADVVIGGQSTNAVYLYSGVEDFPPSSPIVVLDPGSDTNFGKALAIFRPALARRVRQGG